MGIVLKKGRNTMYTNPVNYSFNSAFQAKSQAKAIYIKGQKLIPRAEYKGPILKLTEGDKKKIANLRNEIANLELEHLSLAEYYYNNLEAMHRRDNYDNAFFNIKNQIEALKSEIEEIHKARLQEQIAKNNF